MSLLYIARSSLCGTTIMHLEGQTKRSLLLKQNRETEEEFSTRLDNNLENLIIKEGQEMMSEHLAAVEIMRLQHIIILQNKVDLVQENVSINQHDAIQKFIQGTVVDGAPVVQISVQLKYNMDVVSEYIVKKVPIPERN